MLFVLVSLLILPSIPRCTEPALSWEAKKKNPLSAMMIHDPVIITCTVSKMIVYNATCGGWNLQMKHSDWTYERDATTALSHFLSHRQSIKKEVNYSVQNKSKATLPESRRFFVFFFSLLLVELFFSKERKKCHGFHWMPLGIKRAIHAASWFRHTSLHTNQRSPGIASHSLVCHFNTRWRQCQKFQLKYPFVMSVQKERIEKKKRKENKTKKTGFSIA